MAVLAFIVYFRYTSKVMTDSWWKVQCPEVIW
jgi:hypothetical protein